MGLDGDGETCTSTVRPYATMPVGLAVSRRERALPTTAEPAPAPNKMGVNEAVLRSGEFQLGPATRSYATAKRKALDRIASRGRRSATHGLLLAEPGARPLMTAPSSCLIERAQCRGCQCVLGSDRRIQCVALPLLSSLRPPH